MRYLIISSWSSSKTNSVTVWVLSRREIFEPNSNKCIFDDLQDNGQVAFPWSWTEISILQSLTKSLSVWGVWISSRCFLSSIRYFWQFLRYCDENDPHSALKCQQCYVHKSFFSNINRPCDSGSPVRLKLAPTEFQVTKHIFWHVLATFWQCGPNLSG